MPQHAATIESLPIAFALVKEMQADGLDWGEGYRPLGRRALSEIIEGRMSEAVDHWLDGLDASAMRDRRNGFYRRHLLSELGDIELCVPRTGLSAAPDQPASADPADTARDDRVAQPDDAHRLGADDEEGGLPNSCYSLSERRTAGSRRGFGQVGGQSRANGQSRRDRENQSWCTGHSSPQDCSWTRSALPL